jgi:hypothetical protein
MLRRLVVVVCSLGLVAAFVGVTSQLAGGALRSGRKPAPSVRVQPSTKLHNHEIVKVTGHHYPARRSLVMVECNAHVGKSGAAACDDASATFVTTNSAGAFFSKRFRVVAGKVGNGSCGKKKALKCYLEVTVPNPKTKYHAVATLHFA